jgi:ketosteroid isomerase-like protein
MHASKQTDNGPLAVSIQETIQRYIKAIQQRNLDEVLACFAANGTVVHPMLGTKPTTEFFKSLFSKTMVDKITVKTIFQSADDPHNTAVLFSDEWQTADGTEFANDIVLIFSFDDAPLIQKLTVIFDTFPIRGKM